MKTTPLARLLTALCLLASAATALTQTTAFTYQGRLTDNGAPANGNYDLLFTLRDALTAGNTLGSPFGVSPIGVTNGLFTATVDFGTGAFTGEDRWLEISVRTNGSAGAFTTLAPRQPVTSTPYAIRAASAPFAGMTGLPVALGANTVGSVGNNPFELQVNGQRALRIEPGAGAPNILAGYLGNTLAPGLSAATIAGGGMDGFVNSLTANYTTIGGGAGNRVTGQGGTIAGGAGNTVDGQSAFVGGGINNQALGTYNVIGGGSYNMTADALATVGGGDHNQASLSYSTVAGGGGNRANAVGATVGGGQNNTNYASFATIAGGSDNAAGGETTFIGGGTFNVADGIRSVVAGGSRNVNAVTATDAVIGGGGNNTNSAAFATVPGGQGNAASGSYAFAAGRRAKAGHSGAFVWADSTDADFGSGIADQFNVRAGGGLYFNTGGYERSILAESASALGTWLALNNTSTGGRQWSVISSGSDNGEGAGKLLFFDGSVTRMQLDGSGNLSSGSINSGNITASGTVAGTSASGLGIAGYTTSGTGVFGDNGNSDTTGHAGYFSGRVGVTQTLTAGKLVASTSSTVDGTKAIYGLASGSGSFGTYGVVGEVASEAGVGVYGKSTHPTGATTGVWGRSSSPDGTGVFAEATATSGNAVGVEGSTASPSGAGVVASGSGTSGTALRIQNGAIQVPGAGVNTPTAAYLHVITAGNSLNGSLTVIDHPMCNGNPNAIILVTPIWEQATGFPRFINLIYDSDGALSGSAGKWVIYVFGVGGAMNGPASIGGAATLGTKYNVLIIKP